MTARIAPLTSSARAALGALGLLLTLAGCEYKAPIGNNGDAGDAATVDAGARTCRSSSECGAGLECVGGEGCGTPWTCQPALGRPCTLDYAPFCGCDGATIYGSSSCPPGPYAHRGECPGGPDAGVDASRPDASRPDASAVACNANSDCAAGQECVGGEGCGTPWTCQPALGRACTRDAAPYCSCRGVTVYGSSTCPPGPFAYRGECRGGDAGADASRPDASARSCTSSRDCAAGEECFGPEGCGTPWTCQRVEARICTGDYTAFCGCDGVTIYGSSSCPPGPYSRRGECDAGGDFCPRALCGPGTTCCEARRACIPSTERCEAPAPCVRTGCSGQLCADEELASTCEWRERYACYRSARCERQADGACGWTDTSELRACLAANP